MSSLVPKVFHHSDLFHLVKACLIHPVIDSIIDGHCGFFFFQWFLVSVLKLITIICRLPITDHWGGSMMLGLNPMSDLLAHQIEERAMEYLGYDHTNPDLWTVHDQELMDPICSHE